MLRLEWMFETFALGRKKEHFREVAINLGSPWFIAMISLGV